MQSIQSTINQILHPQPPKFVYPYMGEVGVDLFEIPVVKTEELHLGQFIYDARQHFELILSEKYNFTHHLNEFNQKTQSRKFVFSLRIAYLHDVLRYLDLEEQIVKEYLDILDGHRLALEQLCGNVGNINFGYIRAKEMPNLKNVQQTAHDALDRMGSLHSTLISQLLMPLDSMEMEFQQCIYSDLAGFSSWQQDLKNHGGSPSTATIEEVDEEGTSSG